MVDNKRALNINLNKLEITNVEYGSNSQKINVTQNIYFVCLNIRLKYISLNLRVFNLSKNYVNYIVAF